MPLITHKRTKRILVVDDCQENLWLMQSILASKGYEIVLTPSGKTASAEISKTEIDLVILNADLPNCQKQRAFEVKIRTTSQFCQTPILWLSSDRNIELVDSSLSVDAIIYKPFEINELLDQVSFLLGSNEDTLNKTQNTFFLQVGEQDPLRQQQAELEKVQLTHHPQAFWEKLIADGYEIKNYQKVLTAS